MRLKVKPALAGMGILLLIAIAGLYLYNKPHTGVSNVDTDLNITAAALLKDFEQDEKLANNKYLNKVIEVTGNVTDIQNVNGSQIILLGSDVAVGGVSCKMSNDKNIKKQLPKKSTTITIKGKCSGYLMDVNLVDCIIK
jgi:hypothetical protein